MIRQPQWIVGESCDRRMTDFSRVDEKKATAQARGYWSAGVA